MRTKANKSVAESIMKASGIDLEDDTKMKIDDSFLITRAYGKDMVMPNFNQHRSGTNAITIKTSAATVAKITRAYSSRANFHDSSSKSVSIRLSQGYGLKKNYQVIKFLETSKLNVNAAGVKISAAAMTAMAELGTLWVMRQAIQGNKTFNSSDDIFKDKETWSELVNIWTLIGKLPDGPEPEWLETFYQSNAAFLREMGKPSVTEFNRGIEHAESTNYHIPGSASSKNDSFMDWITDWVKDNYGISKKDTWNPADIWLIKNQDKWKKMIIENCATPRGEKNSPVGIANLNQMNAILRKAYADNEIIGVSLKKATKNQVMIYEAVNTTEEFINMRSSADFKKTYAFSSAQSYFDEAKDGPMTQDTVVYCKGDRISFQVKANSSSDKSGSGLKYEGTERPRTGARLGKAKVEDVIALMKSQPYNLTFDKEKSSYPFTPEEFVKQKADYLKRIKLMVSKGVTIYKNTPLTAEQAVDRLELLFVSQPWVANSKCQQITWLSSLLSLSTDNLNSFMADLVFMAKKEGQNLRGMQYGPFGKIY